MSSAFKAVPIVGAQTELEQLRQQIDHVDVELVSILEKRAALVYKVGDYKRQNQLPAYDPVREKKMKNRVRHLVSEASPLSVNEMESLFTALVEKFRFFESAHMQKSSLHFEAPETVFDFNKSQKVIIWGFGLLGASFYLALNEKSPHWDFRIVDPYLNVDAFLKWKADNELANIELNNSAQMKVADLYVLAGPVDANVKHLSEFSFPENALVFDLGSTKKAMCEAYGKSNQSFIYVGGHPLAGRESSGFENADTLLFYNKTFCWVTAANQKVDTKLKFTLDTLASYLGAKPFWIDAVEHDAALAWTSHLPQFLSSTLAQCLSDKKFSMTSEIFPGVISELLRISGSSLSMWQSIVQTNQQPLQTALSELIQQLIKTQKDLESPQGCQKIFNQSNDFYQKFKKGA